MKIPVSSYIARFLKDKGVKDIFFVDGSAAARLIVSASEEMNYYCPLHEQAGAFMVDGYFKASGRASAMIATSGPGALNLVTGIATSYYDSIPGIFITGNINTRFMKTHPDQRQVGFQETEIASIVNSITKYSKMITDPKDIAYELEKAWHLANYGRPGPVLLDIPMDIQKMEVEEETLKHYKIQKRKDTQPLDKVVELIKESKRPLFLIGGGVKISSATGLLRHIEKLGIPFVETWNAMDFSGDDHPLYGGRVGTYGGDGRNFAIQNCDLLIAIGSRISGRIVGGRIDTFARNAIKVVLDINPPKLRQNQVRIDYDIVADPWDFIRKVPGEKKEGIENWVARVHDWKEKYRVPAPEDSLNPYSFAKKLSRKLTKDYIVVLDIGGTCVAVSQAFEAKEGQIIFSNNGNAALGYSLPASIGAAIATGRKVICVTGDGGFNFNIQELQTLKKLNLPIVIFVSNNNGFGITKLYRDTNCGCNYAGTDKEHGLEMPDFVEVAKAYGIPGQKINTLEELDRALEELPDGPHLYELNTVGYYDFKPRLGWADPIEDQQPYLPREEFRENMIIEPVPGWETKDECV